MRRASTLLLLFVVATGLQCPSYLWGASLPASSIDELTQELDSRGLQQFANLVQEQSQRAPAIYSAWYIARTQAEDPELAAQHETARSFGAAILRQLDAFSAEVRSGSSSATAQACTDLITLSRWLLKQDGYGNTLLASKACDIAGTGIARLLCDLSFPLEEAVDLLNQCNAAGPDLSGVIRVLNAEAGATLFESAGLTRAQLLEKWTNAQLQQNLAQLEAVDSERAQQLEAKLKQQGRAQPLPSGHEEFFADASLPPFATTSTCWDSKQHRSIILTLGLPGLKELQALATFRKEVGAFPLQPKEPVPPHLPAGKAAFREAWLPHATPDTRTLYASAWSAFKQVADGEFLDKDARAIRQAELRKVHTRP